jgi:glycine cleavage system aminomethyltransferase T
MTGNLAYELHGPIEEGPAVFMTRSAPAIWPEAMKHWQVSGSVNPMNIRARNRTPVEVRWHNMAKFDHDFVGREALAAEIRNPKRTTVTLRWNTEDVLDVYASPLRPGQPYKPINLPYAPQRWPMAHAHHITMDGRENRILVGHGLQFIAPRVSLPCLPRHRGFSGGERSYTVPNGMAPARRKKCARSLLQKNLSPSTQRGRELGGWVDERVAQQGCVIRLYDFATGKPSRIYMGRRAHA